MKRGLLYAVLANFIILGSGFLREIVFSYRFGISDFSDSFFVVYLFLEEFNVVITSGVVFGLITFYKKIQDLEINLEDYVKNLMQKLTIGLFISSIIFYMFFSTNIFDNTISSIFLFGANGIILYSMTGVLSAYLIFKEKIFTAIISKAINYTGLIFAFIILEPDKPIFFGLSISLSILLQLIFLSYHFLRINNSEKSYNYTNTLPRIHKFVTQWGLAPFVMPFLGNLLCRLILIDYGDNDLVSYNAYANKLMAIPNAITLSFLLVGFNNAILNNSIISIEKNEIVNTIKNIILILLPLTIIIFFFSSDIIRFTYQRGEFQPYMIYETSIILSVLSLGIVPGTIYSYLIKVYDALNNTNFFAKTSFLWMSINVLITYFLIDYFPFSSFALGSVTALFIVMILSVVIFNKKLNISKSFSYLIICSLVLLIIFIFSANDLLI